jgi:hypothetical protein
MHRAINAYRLLIVDEIGDLRAVLASRLRLATLRT